MNDLNEKLAELCGLSVYDDPEHGYQYINASGKTVCAVKDWNPTTNLNHLRMCYEAADIHWDDDAEGEGLESKFRRCLEPLIDKVCDRYTEPQSLMVIAWVKHPELVAQAILKAKGVSL